jgi:hypothetical protein
MFCQGQDISETNNFDKNKTSYIKNGISDLTRNSEQKSGLKNKVKYRLSFTEIYLIIYKKQIAMQNKQLYETTKNQTSWRVKMAD